MKRMKLFAGILAVGALFAGAAMADTSGFVGNTVNVVGPDGTMVFKYNADGTGTVTYPDGSTKPSTWTLEGNKLCGKANDEAAPRCGEIDLSKKPGDTFTAKDDKGQDVTVSIVAGQ